jgi:hypothetical protein
MTMTWIRALWLALLCGLIVGLFTPSPAFGHPEDEFCVPGEGGLDPALCLALSALDRASTTGDVTAKAESGAIVERGLGETFAVYVRIGVAHIVPGGLDHILFVLALFLSCRKLRPLIWQVSAFTVAHTATLGLTAMGLIAPPASIVEPLIALTIAWAAVENILFKDPKWWRPALVFGFGLIHGMGFAGAFGDLGLPDDMFWSALIGFNVGVELGQLMVIGMAFAAALVIKGVLRRVTERDLYRAVITWPVSGVIAIIGVWWAIERSFSIG